MYFCKFHYLSRMSVWGKTVQRSLPRAVPKAMCKLFSRADKSRAVNYFFFVLLVVFPHCHNVIRSWTVLGMVVVNQIPGLDPGPLRYVREKCVICCIINRVGEKKHSRMKFITEGAPNNYVDIYQIPSFCLGRIMLFWSLKMAQICRQSFLRRMASTGLSLLPIKKVWEWLYRTKNLLSWMLKDMLVC